MSSDNNKINTKRMMKLIKKISPLQRMINSEGLDEAFKILKTDWPEIIIHEYNAEEIAEDWEVPYAWKVLQGTMLNESGEIIASTDENKLFVAPYSEAVEGWFLKEEIEKHLRTRPDNPNAFSLEHRNAYDYHLKDWGITLPHNRWKNLPNAKYHIKIDIKKSKNSMKVAEYFLPGRRQETICFCAHIDELCNDDLSGCVVGVELIHQIAKLKNRQYSYQVILSPEMIGTIFYIHRNQKKIENTLGMLNMETMGAGEKWVFKKSLKGNSLFDNILKEALTSLTFDYREIGFFEGYGNDERVFEWPTIGIPSVSLQRFPFREYHTSDDNPEIINEKYLEEGLKTCIKFVEIVEKNKLPVFTKKIQPWLTKWKLYFNWEKDPDLFHKFNNDVLFHVNGQNSIIDLANIAGLSFCDVYYFLEKFEKNGLIQFFDIPLDFFKRN